MKSKIAKALQCPRCGGSLDLPAGSAQSTCRECKALFEKPYGLIDFSHDANFYWGELEREAMQCILATDLPVEETLQRMLKEEKPELRDYLSHYALDRFRAGWKYLCNLPSEGRVLDFGCGWGALALSLAEHVEETWVSDVVPERVEVVRRRAHSLGLENFYGCVSSGWPNLPFRENYFDLIVLNGVLEWIPASIEGNPQDIQQHFLQEVFRVLKPEGQLYIGIENRFGFSYFRGKPEEHTKLKFISLLPRPFGRVYHRIVKSAPYKEYTYGRIGMRRLLEKSGFGTCKFYCPYPDYREFNKIVDLDDTKNLKHNFSPPSTRGKLFFFIARKTGLLRWFTNSFGVLATKHTQTPSSFIDELVKTTGIGEFTNVKSYKINGTGNILVRFSSNMEGNDCLLTLPVDRRANLRLEKEAEIIDKYLKELPEDFPHYSFKNIISSGLFRRIQYKIERYIHASPASNSPETCSVPNAIDLISPLHKAGLRKDNFSIESFFGSEWISRFCTSLGSDVIAKSDELWSKPFSVNISNYHGDFHLGNILIEKTGDRACLVDWDLAGTNGLPTWDLLNLLCHTRFEETNDWTAAYARACDTLLQTQARSPFITAYIKRLGLSLTDLHLAMFTYPILQWKNKMIFGDQKGELITKNIALEWVKHLDFLREH